MTLTVISSDRDQDNQSAIETLEAALELYLNNATPELQETE